MKDFCRFCQFSFIPAVYSEFFWIKVKWFSEFDFTAKFWVFKLKIRFRMAGERRKASRHFLFFYFFRLFYTQGIFGVGCHDTGSIYFFLHKIEFSIRDIHSSTPKIICRFIPFSVINLLYHGKIFWNLRYPAPKKKRNLQT